MSKRRHCPVRGVLALLCAAALMLGLAGCGSNDDSPELAKDGAELTIAVTGTPDSFNPLTAEGRLAQEFFLLVYDPLWRLDADGQPQACLAEDWSLSSDQLTWTIRLRQGVLFSDGTALTAEDVVFSYELMAQSENAYTDYFDGITSIRAADTYTVVITTEYVKGDMLYNPAPILPKSVWESYQYAPEEFDNAAMIGTGPFAYDAAQSDEGNWVFRARSDYFGGAAQVGSVHFTEYATETSAARALAAGEVDAAIGMTDVQLTTLESVPDVELIQAFPAETEIHALALNVGQGLFASASMRQMMESCVDRAWILSMSSGGAGMTGSVWASPGTDYFLEISDLRGYDLTSAAAVLQAAGYRDMDEDGYLELESTGERLSLCLISSNDDEWASTAATILTEALESIGVEVDWEKVDGAAEDACADDSGWDMCLCSWNGSADAMLAAERFCSWEEDFTGWASDGYDQVYEQLRTAMDSDSVQMLAGQLQQLVYDECPYIILGYQSEIQGMRSDVWTGYSDVLSAAGGLFGIGSVDAYLAICPSDGAEETAQP